MNRRSLACRVILIAGLVTCLAASAFAQGRVRGIVRNEDGNGISGATVTVESFTSPNEAFTIKGWQSYSSFAIVDL